MICEQDQWLDNPPAVLTEDDLELFDPDEQETVINLNYEEWEQSRERAGRKMALAAALTRRASAL